MEATDASEVKRARELLNKARSRDAGARVPATEESFVQQFVWHLRMFPDDTNFLLEVNPGTFGVGERRRHD